MRRRIHLGTAFGAGFALLAFGSCSAVGTTDTAPDAGESQEQVQPLGLAPQDENPGGGAQSEDERRKLAAQRRAVIVNSYIEDARRLMGRGELDRAETALLEAAKEDPTNATVRSMLADVQRQLGMRTGEVTNLAEREAKIRDVRLQKAYAQTLQELENGETAMGAQDYDGAVRAYERAVNLLTWNPRIGEKEASLRDQAEEGLRAARAAAEDARRVSGENARKMAYEEVQKQEQRAAEARARRTAAIIDEAQQRFEEDRFDEAERLCDNVLDEDPQNPEARKLRESIREARHHYNDKRFVDEKKERFRLWRISIEQTKIPESSVIKWPTQSHWDTITRERAHHSPTWDTEDSVAVARIKNKLANETIPMQFDGSASLKDTLEFIRNVANVPIVYDAEIKDEIASSEVGIPLNLEKIKVGRALETVLSAKPEFGMTFKNDVIWITRAEKAVGRPIPAVHDVRDITIPVQDFTPPDIELKSPGLDEDSNIFGTVSDEAPPPYNAEDLIELIKANIDPTTWDSMEGVGIELISKRLVVVHTPDTQKKIRRFLNDLRSFATAIVTVEARFITVRDNFLQDIGVDWRGLGGAGQKGTLAVLDDVTNGAQNMASAGLDNGGTGLPINNIQSPSSGAFFNDGEDGDVRARTENIFDRVLGSMLSSVGGLSLSFAYLDDTQLNMVLRAVEKSERATLMTAPRLTVYNTQRSNITLVNQISYIRDYDVEVAQTASIADPVVGIIQDGLVLDVRPTISNDRRFVTLELRPTVANLIEPIRTLTTTLGSQTQPVTIQLPELIVQSAETTVTVPDRGTVVIGGLKNILSVDRRSEVPFLADIPLLGFFFSRKGKSEEAQDLILVVTVQISDLEEQEAALRG